MMDWTTHISRNPEVLFGKPTIKETRIPVDLILEKLSMGETTENLLRAYPRLSLEKIHACMAFAASLIRNEEVISLAS